MPCSRHHSAMRLSGRRSTSEYCTWFETIANAVLGNQREPLGIEIGQAEMTDQPFLAQIGEVPQRVEIAPVAVIPPMELQQIEALRIHAATRSRDRFLDDASCHRPGGGDPLRESLDLGEAGGAVSRRELSAEGADELLGRAVMVGEVPSREPGLVISEHRRDGARRVDRAMRARDLPHPVQDAADREVCRERETTVRRQCHRASPVIAPRCLRSIGPNP